MKSKLTALFTAFFMVVGLFTIMPMPVSAADSAYWTDAGNYDIDWYTGAGPYTVSSAAELAGLAVLSNGLNGVTRVDFYGKTITLAQDINVSAHLWTPIGAFGYNFKGKFDGNGKTITGAVSSTTYVGGFVGCDNSGKITNCYYYGYNVGIGGTGASQTGTTPFVKINDNPLGTGKITTITEQATADINTAWSKALGEDYAVTFSNNYTSSHPRRPQNILCKLNKILSFRQELR